jgi:hypothetical protein
VARCHTVTMRSHLKSGTTLRAFRSDGEDRRLRGSQSLFPGIHRDKVRSETSIPGLRSSPWTRGAPHSGFEFAILRINSRISRSFPGRPGPLEWDRRVQEEAKRFRCHRRTVSGLTMRSLSFQRSQDCDKRTQKRRSSFRRLGRRRWRFKTVSCWRRARFSGASSEWVLSAVGIRESSRRISGITAGECQAPRRGKSTISTGPEFWRPAPGRGQAPGLECPLFIAFRNSPRPRSCRRHKPGSFSLCS